ncbi:hypothetical protein F180042I2_37850 [Enterocloster bolteae]
MAVSYSKFRKYYEKKYHLKMPEERTVYKVHLPAYHISCQVDYMCVLKSTAAFPSTPPP